MSLCYNTTNTICVNFMNYIEGKQIPPIMIDATTDMKIYEIIQRYRNLTGDQEPYIDLIYNGKKLNQNLTLAEEGILDKSNIFVVKRISDMNLIHVFFMSEGNHMPIMIECTADMKVSKIIKRYRNKAGDYDKSIKFVFNAKQLNPSLTLAEAGILDNSNIFAVNPILNTNLNEISNLNSEINRLNQKIETQNRKIIKLKEELNNSKEIIKNKDSQINEIQNQLKCIKEDSDYNLAQKISKIKILEKQLKKKDLQIENSKNNIKDEKMVKESQIAVINFSSSDQKINYATSCLNSTIFAEIEEKLYKIYPEYRETNNTFIANGKTILRFKTVGENGIGAGFPIILFPPSDEE